MQGGGFLTVYGDSALGEQAAEFIVACGVAAFYKERNGFLQSVDILREGKRGDFLGDFPVGKSLAEELFGSGGFLGRVVEGSNGAGKEQFAVFGIGAVSEGGFYFIQFVG